MAISLGATLYTDEIPEGLADDGYSVRGYLHDGKTWAVVDLGGIRITAVDNKDRDGLAGMQRLIDALQAALAQAKQARQDADLTAELVSA